ncbi:MAG TPA: hypothetical protein VIK77_12470 [Tissierellaceae bacterium]
MKELKLILEQKKFLNANGVEVSYFEYYVEVSGIKIKVKPVDATGKQLLEFVAKGGLK